MWWNNFLVNNLLFKSKPSDFVETLYFFFIEPSLINRAYDLVIHYRYNQFLFQSKLPVQYVFLTTKIIFSIKDTSKHRLCVPLHLKNKFIFEIFSDNDRIHKDKPCGKIRNKVSANFVMPRQVSLHIYLWIMLIC